MRNDGKEGLILIRIQRSRKESWKKACSKRNISLTSLIIDSVESRIMDDERKKISAFIEKQDNIFRKIENNINQVAKIANGQKFISDADLKNFSNKLSEITDLKRKQNEVFIKIYSLLAK